MQKSYQLFTGTGSQVDFTFNLIDGWVSSGFLKVYVNDVLQTTGVSFVNLTSASPIARFVTAPASGAVVRVQRETPSTLSTFRSNIVDFADGSVLKAADLDSAVAGLLHVAQETSDVGAVALGKNIANTAWTAEGQVIKNLVDGVELQDAVTVAQLQNASLYGGGVIVSPQAWSFTGNGSQTSFTLDPLAYQTDPNMFVVAVGTAVQAPSAYTITGASLIFNTAPASGAAITARNFGVTRTVVGAVTTVGLQNEAVTSYKLATNSVSTVKIQDGAVTTAKIPDAAITYAKIQTLPTDKLLGRSTAGTGVIEEIPCTAFARTLLDDTSAADVRATLSLGDLATKDITTFADLPLVAAGTVLGNAGSTLGSVGAFTCTSIGRELLSKTSTADVKTYLGIAAAGSGYSGSVVSIGTPTFNSTTMVLSFTETTSTYTGGVLTSVSTAARTLELTALKDLKTWYDTGTSGTKTEGSAVTISGNNLVQANNSWVLSHGLVTSVSATTQGTVSALTSC